jgi:hypothetical protein
MSHLCTHTGNSPRFGAGEAFDVQTVDCSSDLQKRLARQANEAAETMVPTTFVDDAEFIWKEAEQGKTQAEISEIVGWGIDRVKKYSALRKIDPAAWNVIVPTVENNGHYDEEEVGTSKVPMGTFSERLLREILDLESDQQLELVQALAKGDIQKGKFKAQAEAYKARNEMKTYALQRLGELGEPYTSQLTNELDKGNYDVDWKQTTCVNICTGGGVCLAMTSPALQGTRPGRKDEPLARVVTQLFFCAIHIPIKGAASGDIQKQGIVCRGRKIPISS